MTVHQFTAQALHQLRDPQAFKWYAVTLLVLVAYVYATEIERRRWDVIGAGIAVWLADWFNEIVNAVILHAGHHAALWTTTGPTAYQILIGLNLEITFMFAMLGIVYAKTLPADRAVRILGLPNRLALAIGMSLSCVAIEVLLHALGVLHWAYWWWNWPFVPLIFLLGYMPFFLYAAWVHDAPGEAQRWGRLGAVAAVDLALGLVFGVALGWL